MLKNKNGYKADATVFNEDRKINYQEFEIVGQSYAFKTKAGNLTFNSWENLRYAAIASDKVGDDHIAAQMLKKACNEIIINNCDISRITIGTDGGARTPEELRQNIVLYNEVPYLYVDHLNTSKQIVIAQSPQLIDIQNELKEKAPNIEIMSIKHGEKLKHLLEQPEFAASFNEMLSNNKQLLQVILTYSVIEDLKLTSFQGFSDPKIINLLTSPNALKVYDFGVKIDQLKDLEVKKIIPLISFNARMAYKAGITFDQLKDLEIEQIKAFFSIINNLLDRFCSDDELKKILPDKIKDLTHHTSEEYDSDFFDLQDIDSLQSSEANREHEVDITGQQVVYAY
ncbi:MAG: hypothetical protein LN568_04380 [Rickettsia endosymbiont of Pseudomimeciton antennatum]|nr:hypothetical protein [Rickettsia endosymbiont of Pseudomimeciton antennatum]